MNARAVSRVVAVCVLIVLTPGGVSADREPFGDSLSTEHHGRTRTVDVEHYKLDLTFDPRRSEVRGTSSITVRPLNDGLAVVELDAGEMDVERVTLDLVEGSQRLQFRHEGETLRIELPRSYGADESVTLNVTYSARPRRGLYFVGPDKGYPDKPSQVWSQGESEDSRYWFPSYDYPNDRATTEEIYTVPAEWTAMGNGTLVETTEDASAGTRTFRYRMDTPHVAYLVSVAAGEFEIYTDDFDGIPVEYLVPPGTGEETTLRAFGPTPGMLAFFSERTGVRYPYTKYAQTCAVDFIYGGMENISATTQTAETLRDARAALETDSWGLVAHEAAHQWFGDLLTCANWSHAWLNEGFATYWENLWWEHEHGTDEFLWRMLLDRDSYLEEDREQYRRPIVSQLYTDPMDVFDSHLYPKGGWVLHMIRGILGDEAFFKAIQHYTKKHQNGVVETVDLRRAIAEATGLDMERFFDQWLRHGGHPEFHMTQSWDPDSSTLTLRIEQTQEVDELTPLFTLPVSIAVDTATETVHHRLSLERTVHEVTLHLDAEPRLVRFDPDFRVLYEMEWERPVAQTLQALATDPNPVGRIFAARELADRVAERKAAEALAASAAGDVFFGVRLEAAKALGEVQGDVARAALIRTLADDPDARVRTAAAEALGTFRHDDQVARALEKVTTSEKAYGTYAAAVRSLAGIEASAARKVAMQTLDLDSHGDQLRAAALEALGQIGGAEALATLREWTAYGKPARARTAAIAALPKLAREEDAEDGTTRLLLDLLDDPYIWARGAAIEALAELGAEEALDRLERLAKVEPDSRLRRTARRAIESINEEKSSGKTVEELAAEIERLRRDMRRQSGRLQDLEKQAP